jgi:hypothetical protein
VSTNIPWAQFEILRRPHWWDGNVVEPGEWISDRLLMLNKARLRELYYSSSELSDSNPTSDSIGAVFSQERAEELIKDAVKAATKKVGLDPTAITMESEVIICWMGDSKDAVPVRGKHLEYVIEHCRPGYAAIAPGGKTPEGRFSPVVFYDDFDRIVALVMVMDASRLVIPTIPEPERSGAK